MASAFAHAAVSLSVGTAFSSEVKTRKFWVLGIFCSVFPDMDILAFNVGIPYHHMFGHRGFTHSIFFAVLLAVLITFLFHRESKHKKELSIYYFICTISHGLIDALTTGGMGIAFFAPFSDERIFFPLRIIQVSPLDPQEFFSDWGISVLKSEVFWIGVPCLLFVLITKFMKRQ